MGSRGGMGGKKGGGGGAASGIGGTSSPSPVANVRAELKATMGVTFTANPGAGLITVAVSVAKVNASWAKDKGFYVAPGGGDQKAANVREFLAKAKTEGIKVEQSRMTVDGGERLETDS